MIIHKHHIIPKHAGGTNDPSNIIKLTIEEHAEAHKKLYQEYGRWQDEFAWKMLSGQISNEEANYQKLRLSKLGSNNPMYHKNFSASHRAKLSLARSGKPSNAKGKILGPRPDIVKEKIRSTLLGKKHSPERIEANRLGQIKRYRELNGYN